MSDAFKSNDPVYYLLTQVDVDGQSKSFEIITASCTHATNSLIIYPNPTEAKFIIQFELDQNYTDVQVSITDALGKIVWQENRDLLKGKSNFKCLHNLKAGVYSLVCQSDNLNLPAKKIIIK